MAAQSQGSANLLVFPSCNRDACSSSSHQHSRHREGKGDGSFIRKQNFPRTPQQGCLVFISLATVMLLGQPPQTRETKKYGFLTGNSRLNWQSKTAVWSVRKEESTVLEKQLTVSATVNKEIHYISQSPEAEQTVGSIQRGRQRPRNFPSLHSTVHSVGFGLRPALLHSVGWLPVAIRLHASLFIASRRVWPLKSKEARGHF